MNAPLYMGRGNWKYFEPSYEKGGGEGSQILGSAGTPEKIHETCQFLQIYPFLMGFKPTTK